MTPVEIGALDAIAVALEHAPSWLTLDVARTMTAENAKAVDAPPRSAEDRARALVAVKDAAVERLLAARPGADIDALRAEVNAALTQRPSTAVNLAALMREGVPPVKYLPGELARRMVYAEGVTGFSGHPESGKTSLVGRLALDAIRHGRHVVYLDYENGPTDTLRRFAALGACEAELEPERFTYLPFPGPPDWAFLGLLWDQYAGAFGVFDSMRGIFRTMGINEDRANEVATFTDPLVEFFLARKAPAVALDHVTKQSTASAGYSRGSGDKLAGFQAQWYVDRTRPFSETEAGEIELTNWKARSGYLARTHRLGVGDGAGNLTFRRMDPDLSPVGKIDAAVIAFLREHGAATSSKIEGEVTGTATTIRDRVKALAAAPDRPVTSDDSGAYAAYSYAADLDREPTAPLAF